MLRHFELVHGLASDAELGSKRDERFDGVPRPAALGEPVEDGEHFGARDVRLVAAVERLRALGLPGQRRNVHRCEIPATARARPTDEAHERRTLLFHGRGNR
ncbi:MAG: hypothetical protein AMJ63_15750 [Myxococcales bacterium SG8_38_1]|nr:MAG: hypothetical protein AMJ63_15750 [Myxococcales bacterium SG8_38_1]